LGEGWPQDDLKIKKVRKPGIKKKFEIYYPFWSRANPLICSELKRFPDSK
jgi:hypothetical protein